VTLDVPSVFEILGGIYLIILVSALASPLVMLVGR
jgi:hypothetical protein